MFLTCIYRTAQANYAMGDISSAAIFFSHSKRTTIPETTVLVEKYISFNYVKLNALGRKAWCYSYICRAEYSILWWPVLQAVLTWT